MKEIMTRLTRFCGNTELTTKVIGRLTEETKMGTDEFKLRLTGKIL